MLVALDSVGQGPRLEMITLLMFYPRGSRAGQLWMNMKLNFEAFWTVVRSRDYQVSQSIKFLFIMINQLFSLFFSQKVYPFLASAQV